MAMLLHSLAVSSDWRSYEHHLCPWVVSTTAVTLVY